MQNLTMLEPYVDKALLNQISTVNPLMVALAILVLSVVVGTIVVFIIKVLGKKLASKTKITFDDKLLEAAEEPVFRIIVIGGLYLAISALGLVHSFIDVVLKIVLTVAYLVIIGFAIKVLDILVNHGLKHLASKTDSSIDDEIIPIFHKTVGALIWVFGIIMILGAWGVDIGPFLAGLGIAGLAVSFALQSTLANIFAGVSIILDKTFRVGDKIKLDSGELGVIYDLTLRSTRIRTYDNELIIVPNDKMAKATLKNYTQPDTKVRVVVDFGVEYGNKPEKVIPLIEKAIKENIKGMMDDPAPQVLFIEMADSSLNFKALFWVPNYGEAYGKKLEATDLIYRELNKAKIGIPFPTQTIHVKK